MGLDVPEFLARAIRHALKGMVEEPVGIERIGIGIHKPTAFGVISVKQYHVIAIANEQTVLVVGLCKDAVDIIEHDIGYEQRQ